MEIAARLISGKQMPLWITSVEGLLGEDSEADELLGSVVRQVLRSGLEGGSAHRVESVVPLPQIHISGFVAVFTDNAHQCVCIKPDGCGVVVGMYAHKHTLESFVQEEG